MPRLLSPQERRVFDIGFSHGHTTLVLSEEEECDDEAFATKTGDDLVEHIRTTPVNCTRRLYSEAASRFAAFRRQNMIDVAEAATPLAVDYDGTNSSNIRELFLFLRAGFYVEFYEGAELDWSEPDDDVAAAVVDALDAFTDNVHFYDETEAHGDYALSEVVILMDSSVQNARYLPEAKTWLQRWKPALVDMRWARRVVNSFYYLLFRGHRNEAFVDATAEDHELVWILRDFALDDWMLDTVAEYLAANAGGELARFSQYHDAAIHADVRDAITSILERYEMDGEGRAIWITTASIAAYHDDCEAYGICGFEEELEAGVLAVHHSCSDSVAIRAQDLEPAELDRACAVMADGERYFRVRLRTGDTPVADDHNTSLEVVVFASSADYELYSPVFFGNDTNNGGIYLEGDPSDPGNTARFIAYVASWLEHRPVWNLAHEQIHYLDGRFNMRGGFGDYRVDTHQTVWWLEGLAEYFSRGNANRRAVETGRSRDFMLSEVFPVVYGDGQTLVYQWGYLAVRFMFEHHLDDVDTMLAHFRAGDYEAYLDHLRDGIGTAYDEEWEAWLLDVPSAEDDGLDLIELPERLSVVEGSSATYQMALAWKPLADVEVDIAVEGTGVDVAPSRVAFSPEDWDSGKTVQVEAYEDDTYVHETLNLIHTASGGGYDGARALLALDVRDSAPEISFVDTSASAAEGGTAVLRVAVSRPLESAATFGFRLGRDDDPGTYDADADDHGAGDGEATIRAGETEVRIEIPVLDDDVIEPARETLAVWLDPSTIPVFVHGRIRAAVVIEEGVCDRTPGVRDFLRDDRPCEAVTVRDLAERYTLALSGVLNGELRIGDLQGLTGVGDARFSDNALKTLPSGAFAHMRRLGYLYVNGNEIEELPIRPFEGPGALRWLYLERNNLSELPAGLFAGHGHLSQVRLDNNPGAPFTLTLEWSRLRGFSVEATVREGTPFDMRAGVSVVGGTASADSVTVPAGAVASDPVTITPDGSGPVRLAFASTPALPPAEEFRVQGVETAAGGDLVIVGDFSGFANVPTSYRLRADVERRIALADLFPDTGDDALGYSAVSSDPSIVDARIEDGMVLLLPTGVGSAVVSVTVDEPGVSTILDLSATIVEPFLTSIPFFPTTSDAAGRRGLMRIVNRSGHASTLGIDVFAGDGTSAGSLTLSIAEGSAVHVNSRDMATGNDDKGLFGGTKSGEGPWRLEIATTRGIDVLSYVRTPDGMLASIHDVAPTADNVHRVATFNPGSNTAAESLLRLANPTARAATATIRGVDDSGSTGGEVSASVPAHGSLTIAAHELESGAAPGLTGALGDGRGKWQIEVESTAPIEVMGLLSSSTGHLTNLSSAPSNGLPGVHAVPLFPAASNALGRQGFVRVVNRSTSEAVVDIVAFDETQREYESLTLTVGADRVVHFNSDDLERGNEDKGLSGSTGAGEGDWRLELSSEAEIEVLSYIRTGDGFLTAMHDVVAGVENRHRVPFFNPGRNVNQVSRLRLINAGEEAADVTITGVDDAGESGSEVRLSVAAGTASSFAAVELETGNADLEGALGTGVGKWQLIVESDQPITVMNLLEAPGGYLTNLSTVPMATRRSVDATDGG